MCATKVNLEGVVGQKEIERIRDLLSRGERGNPLNTRTKEAITREFQLHDRDANSADVQIALLTYQVGLLTYQTKKEPENPEPKLIQLKILAQRRRLLDYLKSIDRTRYGIVLRKTGIRS